MAKFFQDVPESERASSKDLIATTDHYFDGIEQSSGSIVPFAKDVIRVENGTQIDQEAFGEHASGDGIAWQESATLIPQLSGPESGRRSLF